MLLGGASVKVSVKVSTKVSTKASAKASAKTSAKTRAKTSAKASARSSAKASVEAGAEAKTPVSNPYSNWRRSRLISLQDKQDKHENTQSKSTSNAAVPQMELSIRTKQQITDMTDEAAVALKMEGLKI
jgi:hypothetical protein